MNQEMTTIPYHALPVNDAAGGTRNPDNPLRHADIILVQDTMRKEPTVIYGRQRLQSIIANGGEGEAVRVLCVEIDMDTTELESLCAMVEVIRGRCDYRGGGAPIEPREVHLGGAPKREG